MSGEGRTKSTFMSSERRTETTGWSTVSSRIVVDLKSRVRTSQTLTRKSPLGISRIGLPSRSVQTRFVK